MNRVVAVGLCGLVLLAIGSHPRLLEELCIGGGFGDVADGGLDIDHEGNVATDGDLTVARIGVEDDADLVELSENVLSVNGEVRASLDISSERGLYSKGISYEALPPEGTNICALFYDSAFGYGGVAAGDLSDGIADKPLALLGSLVQIGATSATSTSLAGDLLVNGRDIGIYLDQDLVGLSTNAVTVRGSLTANDLFFANDASVEEDGGDLALKADAECDFRYYVGGTERYRLTPTAWYPLYNTATLGASGTRWGDLFAEDGDFTGDVTAGGGDITGGSAYGTRGTLALWDGDGGSAPAYIVLHSPNGTAWYLFAEDDGTLKASSSAPAQNSDGDAVGDQTD